MLCVVFLFFIFNGLVRGTSLNLRKVIGNTEFVFKNERDLRLK